MDIRASLDELRYNFGSAPPSSAKQRGQSSLRAQNRILRDRMKACKYLLLSRGARILRLWLMRKADSTQVCEYAFQPALSHTHPTFVVDIQTGFNQLFHHFDMAPIGSGKQHGLAILHEHTIT